MEINGSSTRAGTVISMSHAHLEKRLTKCRGSIRNDGLGLDGSFCISGVHSITSGLHCDERQ